MSCFGVLRKTNTQPTSPWIETNLQGPVSPRYKRGNPLLVPGPEAKGPEDGRNRFVKPKYKDRQNCNVAQCGRILGGGTAMK